jgi:hypothetical protein
MNDPETFLADRPSAPCSPLPIRVQLSRKKGWKMPPNTMSVARPHAMGNPHHVGFCPTCGVTHTREEAIAEFAAMFAANPYLVGMTELALKGKNLACWCKLDEPCHADFLIRLSNAEVRHGAKDADLD